jgi:enoyl-CoA hydratase
VLSVSDDDGVALVRIDHGAVGALDLELLEVMATTFAGLGDADAVVLTGTGRAFSAGVDLRRVVDGGRDYVAAFLPALSAAFLAVFECPRPVIAAVNGHAIAGGCIFACACDLRLMSGGTIGLAEVLVGVPFPAVPLEIARHVLGGRTGRFALSGRSVDAAEAHAAGLVDEVCDPETLLPRAVEHARAYAAVPHDVFDLTKRALRAPAMELIERRRKDDDVVLERWSSPETAQAMTDYLARLAKR